MTDEASVPLDWLVTCTTLVTMDATRRIRTDAYLGVRGDRIVAIGKQADLDRRLADGARHTVDGRRFDAEEVALLAGTGTHVVHCPTAALHGGYGAGPVGRFPEMVASGANIAIGTDGNTAGSSDMMKATSIVAGLFKDAHRDTTLFPAHDALTMVTLGGARALQLGDTVGALEVGRKADFVPHDTGGPEWRPLSNVVNHLVWSADGRSVHSVWVDGVRVVDDHRTTLVDEAALLARVDAAGRALVARSGLQAWQAWPVV